MLDTSTGRLGTSDPDGTAFRPLPGPAFPANFAASTADGRQVVVGGTQVTDVAASGVTPRPAPLSASGDWLAATQPWADGNKRVVLTSTGPGQVGDLESVDADGGTPHDLGAEAGGAAADPTRDGAVVAVQGGTEVNLGPYVQRDTSRVELRWWKARHRSAVLATTAELARAAGLPAGQPYAVSPLFSPDGRYVALSLERLVAGGSPAGSAGQALVVTDRSGKVLGSSISYTSIQPVWSHDSRQVAYPSDGGLTLLTVKGKTVETRTISAQVLGTACLFSPGDDYLLCDDPQSGDRSIVRLADGHVDQVHHDQKGVAIVWLSDAVPDSATTPSGVGT